MAKSYLVTGGSGFIGSALVRRLVERGDRVRVLDNLSRGNQRRLAGVDRDVEFVQADIRDAAAVSRATKGIDCVCHEAFVNGTQFFYSMPQLVLDVGIRGMLNVLDACLQHDVPELFVASSSEVYQTPPRIPTDETAPLSIPDPMNPRYSYAAGKITSEMLAINYARTHFKRMVIFRPHNVYGPDMGWEHVIPQFILRLGRLCQGTEGSIRFNVLGYGPRNTGFRLHRRLHGRPGNPVGPRRASGDLQHRHERRGERRGPSPADCGLFWPRNRDCPRSAGERLDGPPLSRHREACRPRLLSKDRAVARASAHGPMVRRKRAPGAAREFDARLRTHET